MGNDIGTFSNRDSMIFFFFFDMSTQKGRGRIRTNDLRFMRRGPQPTELPLENRFNEISICKSGLATIIK